MRLETFLFKAHLIWGDMHTPQNLYQCVMVSWVFLCLTSSSKKNNQELSRKESCNFSPIFSIPAPEKAESKLRGPLVPGWGRLQQAALYPVFQVLKGKFPWSWAQVTALYLTLTFVVAILVGTFSSAFVFRQDGNPMILVCSQFQRFPCFFLWWDSGEDLVCLS